MTEENAATMRELTKNAIEIQRKNDFEHAEKVMSSILSRIRTKAEEGYYEYESNDLQTCSSTQRMIILDMLRKRGFRTTTIGHNYVLPVYNISWRDENAS